MSNATATIPSPVGALTLIASEHGLRAALIEGEREGRVPLEGPLHEDPDHPVIAEATRQLDEYFAGERTTFDIALDPEGTEFQQAVWQVLRAIPYGETISYGEQARRLGDPRKARAVGAANGRNPISIIVPCHRVIGASGDLTGYAGGLDVKRSLLALEQRVHTGAGQLTLS